MLLVDELYCLIWNLVINKGKGKLLPLFLGLLLEKEKECALPYSKLSIKLKILQGAKS